MKCPKCGLEQIGRVKRKGLLERFLLPMFGYFPWQCGSCRFHHLIRERGLRRRSAVSAATNGNATGTEPRSAEAQLAEQAK